MHWHGDTHKVGLIYYLDKQNIVNYTWDYTDGLLFESKNFKKGALHQITPRRAWLHVWCNVT